MTSQLNVDTIVDKAGSGGTNVKIGNTSTYVSENSTTTQNAVQALCKAWYDIDGSGTASVLDSFNNASLTDNGTGDFTVTRASAMNSTSYAVGAMSDFDGSDSRVVTVTSNEASTARTTTVIRHALQDTSANGHDPNHFSAVIFGDLA